MGWDSPQRVEYGNQAKIRGSRTDVEVARGVWSTDEAGEGNVEDPPGGAQKSG